MFSRTLVAFVLSGALSGALGLGMAMAGCTTGATPDCGPEAGLGDAGCGPGYDGPPGEGSFADVTTEAAPGPEAAADSTADVAPDVAPDVAEDVAQDSPSSEAGVPAGCHKSTGTGATLVCNYQSTGPCTGEKAGSCPAKGLAGCCVTGTDGAVTAVCYYSKDVPPPSVDETACTAIPGNTWVTTAP